MHMRANGSQLRKLFYVTQKYIYCEYERVEMGKETVQTLRVDNDKLKEKLTHISKEFKKGKRQ